MGSPSGDGDNLVEWLDWWYTDFRYGYVWNGFRYIQRGYDSHFQHPKRVYHQPRLSYYGSSIFPGGQNLHIRDHHQCSDPTGFYCDVE